MLKEVSSNTKSIKDFELSLDAIAREGARRLLIQALNLEVEDYIQKNISATNGDGHRLVVRNGVGKKRTVTIGGASIELQQPRVDDRREGESFLSAILPRYLRKSPKVESLLPLLYLKGLSTNDFKNTLSSFFGEGTLGLSPASIVKLKRTWESEFTLWETREITKKYVYIWADGVNVQVRLGEDKWKASRLKLVK